MFTSNRFFSVFVGVVAGAIITLGLVAFRTPETPALAQTQPTATAPAGPTASPTASPTPFEPGPEVEGPEIGEGITREGGVFINDLAQRLNVPVSTLEADMNASFTVAANQAVTDGYMDQNTANELTAREANLFTSGNGFIFDIDEFPPSSVAIPVTGGFTATPEVVTATPNSEETEENESSQEEEEENENSATQEAENGESHEHTATPRPTHTPTPTPLSQGATATPTNTPLPTHTPMPTHTPRPTHTPIPTHTPRPTHTPIPTHTPRPTRTPIPGVTPLASQPEDFNLFYLPY